MSENSGVEITSQKNDENNTKTSTKKEEQSSLKRPINEVTSEDSNSVLDGEDSNSNHPPQPRKATPKNAKKLKSSENGEGDQNSKQAVTVGANNEAPVNDDLDDEDDDEEDDDEIVAGDFEDEDDEEGEDGDGDAADDDDDEDD